MLTKAVLINPDTESLQHFIDAKEKNTQAISLIASSTRFLRQRRAYSSAVKSKQILEKLLKNAGSSND